MGTVRGDSSVAGEGRVVGVPKCAKKVFGVPKFHSWGKCTMTLTNINSDWLSNTCVLYWVILRGSPLSASWGVIYSIIRIIMGPSYVHQLLWGIALVTT